MDGTWNNSELCSSSALFVLSTLSEFTDQFFAFPRFLVQPEPERAVPVAVVDVADAGLAVGTLPEPDERERQWLEMEDRNKQGHNTKRPQKNLATFACAITSVPVLVRCSACRIFQLDCVPLEKSEGRDP